MDSSEQYWNIYIKYSTGFTNEKHRERKWRKHRISIEFFLRISNEIVNNYFYEAIISKINVQIKSHKVIFLSRVMGERRKKSDSGNKKSMFTFIVRFIGFNVKKHWHFYIFNQVFYFEAQMPANKSISRCLKSFYKQIISSATKEEAQHRWLQRRINNKGKSMLMTQCPQMLIHWEIAHWFALMEAECVCGWAYQ